MATVGIALEYWSFSAPLILALGGLAVVFGCISAALQACANRRAKKAPKERGVACAPEWHNTDEVRHRGRC